MTKKLYYDNTNLKSFDAQVISCLSEDDAFLVELSETAFYPEGGGQPGDCGHLNDALVLDVFTRDGSSYTKLTRTSQLIPKSQAPLTGQDAIGSCSSTLDSICFQQP